MTREPKVAPTVTARWVWAYRYHDSDDWAVAWAETRAEAVEERRCDLRRGCVVCGPVVKIAVPLPREKK